MSDPKRYIVVHVESNADGDVDTIRVNGDDWSAAVRHIEIKSLGAGAPAEVTLQFLAALS